MNFKIAIVQFNPKIGDVDENIEKHLEYIKKASDQGCSLIIFPELSLTGYALGDGAAELAIRADDSSLDPLLEKSEDISICVGAVEYSSDYFIYNSSFFLESGRALNVYRKIYPPTYGVFDEKRFFAQGNKVAAFDSRLGRFGCLICNDARHPALPYILAMDGCRFMIVQAAVPVRGSPRGSKPDPALYFETGNRHYATVYAMYVFYSNLCGYEDGLLFGGNSMVVAPGGHIVAEAPLFDEAMITAEVSEDTIKRCRFLTPILAEEKLDLTLDELIRIKDERWRER